MKNILLIFMVFMTSFSIFGQMTINPFEVTTNNPIIITNPGGTLYINPCLNISLNSCVFNRNSTCVYDGEGQHHCECKEGFKHIDETNDKSTCVEECTNKCEVYDSTNLKVTCSNKLVEGKELCLQESEKTKWEKCVNNPSDPK